MRDIHTSIVSQHLAARDNNKILRTHPQQVSSTEENLPRHTHRTLVQLRTNKSPFLLSINTKLTHQHTHHHSVLFVAFTNIQHNISSVAHRYAPRCRPWICGGIQTLMASEMMLLHLNHCYISLTHYIQIRIGI